jgi:hypothetical protein
MFKSFQEFYPYYLSQHSNLTNRQLHFVGSNVALLSLALLLLQGDLWFLLYAILGGYGLEWVGHFFFEGNKPATWKNPIYSLMGDCMMYTQILRGDLKIF